MTYLVEVDGALEELVERARVAHVVNHDAVVRAVRLARLDRRVDDLELVRGRSRVYTTVTSRCQGGGRPYARRHHSIAAPCAARGSSRSARPRRRRRGYARPTHAGARSRTCREKTAKAAKQYRVVARRWRTRQTISGGREKTANPPNKYRVVVRRRRIPRMRYDSESAESGGRQNCGRAWVGTESAIWGGISRVAVRRSVPRCALAATPRLDMATQTKTRARTLIINECIKHRHTCRARRASARRGRRRRAQSRPSRARCRARCRARTTGPPHGSPQHRS